MARVAAPVVTFTWEPDPLVLGDAILEVAGALENRIAPMEFARQATQDSVRKRFETETDTDGMPWDRWSDKYTSVAEAYPNIGILRQSTELFDSVVADDAYLVTNDALFFDGGNMPDRGIWHQEGRADRRTKGGAANPLPKRAFLGLTDEAEAMIFAGFIDWFEGAIAFYPTSTGRVGRRHSRRSRSSGQFIGNP